MLLAGDIGGTKTHLVLFKPGKEREIGIQEYYPSKIYPTLQALIASFLSKHRVSVDCAVLGIAGPVENNRCKATNLPWEIDGKDLEMTLKIPRVALINDLEANAYGLEILRPDELETLYEGEKNARGNRALISAGTGLGEGGLYWDGKKHHPFACEGSHVDFGPRDEREVQLLLFLKQRYSHVSYERVVSGMGLVTLYKFLSDQNPAKISREVEEQMLQEDPGMVVTRHAMAGTCFLCEETLNWFVSLYGSEAGNLALKIFALGGVYIGGGIAPKILPFMRKPIFLESFLDKGRMKAILEKMPIRIVLNENTALYGAMHYALKLYRENG